MKKLLSAFKHIHSQGIVHRDIKPENIMVTKDDELKVIDFGLSKQAGDGKKMKTIAGTPYYMAPEVLERQLYNSKVDMWSLGVILYVFMSGYLPFQGDNRAEVFEKIQSAKFHFRHKEFNDCSDKVKDLISKLLQKDPSKRLSADEAIKHDWFHTDEVHEV